MPPKSFNIEDLMVYHGDKTDFALLYSSYHQDFPVEERKDWPTLLTLLEQGVYQLILLRSKLDPTIIGYALIYEIRDLNVVWLDYLAVNPCFRGQGLGSFFLKAILQTGNPQAQGIFVQVEIPDPSNPALNFVQQQRIHFYEKSGFQKLNISYCFPSVKGAFPLALYYKSNSSLTTLSGSFMGVTLIQVFRALHANAPDSKHILDSNLKALPQQILLT